MIGGVYSYREFDYYFIYEFNVNHLKLILDTRNIGVGNIKIGYYSGRLSKYTEDNDLQDSLLRVEKIYNASGRETFYKEYNKYNGSIMVWENIYNDKGILEKKIYRLDGVLEYSQIYKYN